MVKYTELGVFIERPLPKWPLYLLLGTLISLDPFF